MTASPDEIHKLIERLETAEGPSRELDLLLDCMAFDRRQWSRTQTVPTAEADYYEMPEGICFDITRDGLPLLREDHPSGEWARGPNDRIVRKNPHRRAPAYFTSSIDAARELLKQVLPGWSYRVAECCVSDDAWVMPDFNCSVHGDRLKQELNQDVDWANMTDVDLRPSGRPAMALCIAILLGLQFKSSGLWKG